MRRDKWPGRWIVGVGSLVGVGFLVWGLIDARSKGDVGEGLSVAFVDVLIAVLTVLATLTQRYVAQIQRQVGEGKDPTATLRAVADQGNAELRSVHATQARMLEELGAMRRDMGRMTDSTNQLRGDFQDHVKRADAMFDQIREEDKP